MDFTISQLASDAYACFESAERSEAAGGGTFIRTKEDCPAWVNDLVRNAHGDYLPDDWRYDTIHSALSHISDSDADTSSDLDDASHEFADSAVDVYTADRYKWLSSNLTRSGYVDDAQEEGLISAETGIVDRIGIGQYKEAEEVFEAVRRFLQDRLDEIEADEPDRDDFENEDEFRHAVSEWRAEYGLTFPRDL